MEMTIPMQKCGFIPDCCMTNAIFALQLLMEKFGKAEESVQYRIFINLEKASDKVSINCCDIVYPFLSKVPLETYRYTVRE